MIDPRLIQWQHHAGNGDIDLTLDSSFAGRWAIAHIRCHFRTITGSPTSTTAIFTISLDSDLGVEWDVVIHEEGGIGLPQDFFLRVRTVEESAGYTFNPRDRLQFAWTNPDSTGKIGWGLEAGFAPVE